MSEIYVKQQDGSLKPVKLPSDLAQKLLVYLLLKEEGLA